MTPEICSETMEENQRLKERIEKLRNYIKEAADNIDWDQQYASCYHIGEDGAEGLLVALGEFDWSKGLCNESVEAFLKEAANG